MTATIAHFIDGKAAFGNSSRSAEVFNPATGAVTATPTRHRYAKAPDRVTP